MVAPLVYDLQLELESDECEISAVHGVPGNADDNRLLSVKSLFPSPSSDSETRGGIILVELDAAASTDPALVASWVERDGSTHSERVTVELPDEVPTFDHDGVRKAIALARYVNLLRAWARDVHGRSPNETRFEHREGPRGQGRKSVPLTVSESRGRQFKTLRAYLVAEATAVDDDTLQQEVELLERLCAAAGLQIQPTIDRGGDDD